MAFLPDRVIRPRSVRSTHKAILNLVPWMRSAGVGSILDVGCETGLVIRELCRHGFSAFGTESGFKAGIPAIQVIQSEAGSSAPTQSALLPGT